MHLQDLGSLLENNIILNIEFKNLTEEAVYGDVYPVWSYSYFALLVPVFLLTDMVRYKPMIVLEALSLVATWVILLWAEGVAWMQGRLHSYRVAFEQR